MENEPPRKLYNFVNNQSFIHSQNTKTKCMDVISPANNKVIAHVPMSSREDVEYALQEAEKAFSSWSQKTVKDRCSYLLQIHHVLLSNIEEITDLVVLEHGKTKQEAIGSFKKGLETLEYAISLPTIFPGKILEVSRGVTCQERRMPLGVVVSIVPFNFPVMVPFWTMPIAIACGNTLVLKPSEKVPLTMDLVCKLIKDVLPPGVLNLVHGDKETVNHLIESPTVKAVTFVGTTQVARIVSRKCRSLDKRCLALGGAKNFLIALSDCNKEMTAKDVVSSFTGCTGQRCMAASVLLIVGAEGSLLLDSIVEQTKKLTPGCGASQMGPVIDTKSKENILKYIKESEESGAKIILDGRSNKLWNSNDRNNWLGPTIIVHKNKTDSAMTNEIFGPVLSVYFCASIEDAIQIENENPYGNAACVYTNNGEYADQFSKKLSAGMIGINVGVPVPREPFSFGGFNDSNIGDSDITGMGGVDFFTKLRKITTKWTPPSEQSWLN